MSDVVRVLQYRDTYVHTYTYTYTVTHPSEFGLFEEDPTVHQDEEDDTGSPLSIWQVTTVTEENLETTEGEVMDLYDKLMELSGWKSVDNEKENVTVTTNLILVW
jgi:hypothetical protein